MRGFVLCGVLGTLAAPMSTLSLAQLPDCRTAPAGAIRIEAAHHTLVYRTVPARITVSAHFSLDVTVCAKAGVPPVQAIAVDALMPAHGHGMNYRPSVKSIGEQKFRVDGLMFHMPGRWQLIFDLRSGEATERIAHDVVL